MKQLAFFQAVTRLMYGEGAIEETGQVMRESGAHFPMIITDRGMVQTGIVDRVVEALKKSHFDSFVFDRVEPDPSIETVMLAVHQYVDQGCDSLLALGGGSPMDCAKAAGVLVTNSGSLDAYFGANKVLEQLPPLIAIPTTVGTGSEVTTFAVISDNASAKKKVIGSPLVAPRWAILDPQVVASLPNKLVAATGMDALTHAIESVISVFSSPFSDALALESIRLIHDNLERALDSDASSNGSLSPRANLLYASTMAGQAFSYARTGLVHGMAHPVGCFHHVHHGLGIAILLPYVLSFNLPACAPKLARVAEALGRPADPQAAIDTIVALRKAVGIPDRLSEVGVTAEHLPQMAQDAFESGNAQLVNPRKPTYEEVLALYQQSL